MGQKTETWDRGQRHGTKDRDMEQRTETWDKGQRHGTEDSDLGQRTEKTVLIKERKERKVVYRLRHVSTN